MPPVIMLFAKAPVPGRVKTRLQPFLSPEQCAELHLSFVGDVLEWLGGFTGLADIELHTDDETQAWGEFSYPRKLQEAGDLGHRMLSAARNALATGRPKALILGSDAPTLPTRFLMEILDSTADLTLGPAEDGGYYAIAFRKTAPQQFDGVEWSTAQALNQTIEGAKRAGMSVALGRSWFDIDSPEDLQRLASNPVPPRTAAWLKNHQFLVEARHNAI